MAHIAIADNNGLKFTKDLMDHWIAKGHDVRYERGSSEFLAQWADMYYVDTWDNNAVYLYNLYHGLHDEMPADWDNTKKPTIVVRALDWEVWLGKARDQQVIDWIDKIICIAPHIEKELNTYANFSDKLRLIRPGVNLERFTPKTKVTDGFQLGMVLGDMWWPKNHMAGLDIFTTLYRKDNRWRLHIRGQHEGGTDYWKKMYDHYIESRGIADAVTIYGPYMDMNDFYETIDVLLHPGMKEAFCYAVGESMAKEICVVCNEFYGSRLIWPEWILYQTHEEAIDMIVNQRVIRKAYREYIQNNYNLDRMLNEYDKFLGL